MAHDLYLKLGSGPNQLLGECRKPHHLGWFKILQWRSENGAPLVGSATAGGHAGQKVTKIYVTMDMNESSASIRQAISYGRRFDSALIDMIDANTGRPRLRLEFKNVLPDDPRWPGPDLDEFVMKFDQMSVNESPIPDDSIERMLGVFARMMMSG